MSPVLSATLAFAGSSLCLGGAGMIGTTASGKQRRALPQPQSFGTIIDRGQASLVDRALVELAVVSPFHTTRSC